MNHDTMRLYSPTLSWYFGVSKRYCRHSHSLLWKMVSTMSKQHMSPVQTLRNFPYPELLKRLLSSHWRPNWSHNTWKISISQLALQETGQHHYQHSITKQENHAQLNIVLFNISISPKGYTTAPRAGTGTGQDWRWYRQEKEQKCCQSKSVDTSKIT